MKDGCDGVIYHNQGAELPKEKEILQGKIFEPEEMKEMNQNGMSAAEIQKLISFEASYRFASWLIDRQLGTDREYIDKLKLTMYAKQ